MLKHSKTLNASQIGNKELDNLKNANYDQKLSLSSTSFSSSSTDSMLTEDGVSDENIARQVWNRYTVSGLDLNKSRDRSFPVHGNHLEFSDKPRSLPTNSKLHASSFSKEDPTEAGGDAENVKPSAPKKTLDEVDNNVFESSTFLTNSPIQEEVSSFKRLWSKFGCLLGSDSKSVFGLSKLEMLIVVILLVVCFVLYLILLMLTVKAASCSEMIENYVAHRQDWIERLLATNESTLI